MAGWTPAPNRRRPRAALSSVVLLVLAGLAGCSRDRDTTPLPAPPPEASFACGEAATAIAGLPRTRGQGIAQLGRVELEAVVVADFRDGLGGFVLQSAAGEDDGDAATPEGVFVAHDPGRGPVRVGQRLRVRGLWARSDDPAESEWALRDVTDLLDCGPGELPAAVELAEPPADWAALSGMRVRLPGPLAVSGNDGLLRFGELLLAFGDRLYAPTELEELLAMGVLDVIQAPLSIVDRRLVLSGWLDRLQQMGVEVHVRSVFLQGLLLMPAEQRPASFQAWQKMWDRWDQWLREQRLSPLEACLRYVLGFDVIARVVIGVDSLAQLRQIIAACGGELPDVPDELRSDDVDLINPSRWQLP